MFTVEHASHLQGVQHNAFTVWHFVRRQGPPPTAGQGWGRASGRRNVCDSTTYTHAVWPRRMLARDLFATWPYCRWLAQKDIESCIHPSVSLYQQCAPRELREKMFSSCCVALCVKWRPLTGQRQTRNVLASSEGRHTSSQLLESWPWSSSSRSLWQFTTMIGCAAATTTVFRTSVTIIIPVITHLQNARKRTATTTATRAGTIKQKGACRRSVLHYAHALRRVKKK